jgi:hypothetical protein
VKKIIRVAGVVVGCTVLGFLGGLVIQSPLSKVISEGAFTRWCSLGSPSERITNLLWIGQYGPDHVIYAETEAGNVYRCCPQGPGQWERAERPEYVWDQECWRLPPRASPPPRPVRACVEIGAYEWGTYRTQFALLDDGTVWMWHHETNIGTLFVIVCWSSLLGGVVGVLLAWHRERSKRHHSS